MSGALEARIDFLFGHPLLPLSLEIVLWGTLGLEEPRDKKKNPGGYPLTVYLDKRAKEFLIEPPHHLVSHYIIGPNREGLHQSSADRWRPTDRGSERCLGGSRMPQACERVPYPIAPQCDGGESHFFIGPTERGIPCRPIANPQRDGFPLIEEFILINGVRERVPHPIAPPSASRFITGQTEIPRCPIGHPRREGVPLTEGPRDIGALGDGMPGLFSLFVHPSLAPSSEIVLGLLED
ncbi:hypothetical protein CEXT_214381 [Caerostris extrusa]|uniref:Uncharacterized protein n=1 Tax=Caerostris extrusa TaxID=172846 RepID=A0AAV4NEK0_CAEEX|nr:hypothetical protein CEXT_214381 [Caerostris extrusa]